MGTPLPTIEARFVLRGPSEADHSLDGTGRRLYHFFSVIEGIRSAANETGASQARPSYAPPPSLQRLKIASPATLALEIVPVIPTVLVLSTVRFFVRKAFEIPQLRKQWLEGDGQREQNQILKIEKELKQLELEQANRREEAAVEIVGTIRREFPGSTIHESQLHRLVSNFVLPHLESLGAAGVTDLDQAPLTGLPIPKAIEEPPPDHQLDHSRTGTAGVRPEAHDEQNARTTGDGSSD